MLDRLKKFIDGHEGEQNEEAQYINDRRAALLLHSPRGARLLIYMILTFFMVFILWASFAGIDETVKGMGKIIPSKHIQQIQNLEGGVLKNVFVKEGQQVEKGQPLMEISDVQFASSMAERESDYYSVLAKRKRLSGEAKGREPIFPDDLKEKYPAFVEDEMRLYKRNQIKLENDIKVYKSRMQQQIVEKEKLVKQLGHAKEREKISRDKLARMERLVKRGSVSEMDVIQAQEEVDDWVSKKENTSEDISKAQAFIEELQESVEKIRSDFRSKSAEEHNQVKSKSLSLKASISGIADKQDRTHIVSPVKGIVNKIHITTIGGSVRPGMTLIEVVPLDDKLVVEARIKPKDIGFLRTGLKAKVKLTAYSFATYGGLEGTLATISADAITTPKGETFFITRVETKRTGLGTEEHPLPIIPGMQAEVDIIVDRKTVLSYLLKPMLKAREKFITPK
jgi:adhesin transport system membrane fusion protein